MWQALEVRDWNDRLTFSPGVRAGDFIFLSGLTASDAEGRIVCPHDIVGQMRFIYEKIASILDKVGADLGAIVETTEFFVPCEEYKNTAHLRRALFPHRFPAATGIPVSQLIRKEALVEIRAVAYVPISGERRDDHGRRGAGE